MIKVAIMTMEHQIVEKQDVTIHRLHTTVPNVSEEISEEFLLDFDDLAVQVGLLLTSIFPTFRLVTHAWHLRFSHIWFTTSYILSPCL